MGNLLVQALIEYGSKQWHLNWLLSDDLSRKPVAKANKAAAEAIAKLTESIEHSQVNTPVITHGVESAADRKQEEVLP